MFVKPHHVSPLLCFNVQTEMIFWVEQLLFPEGRRCKKELFYSKSHFSLHVKAKQRRHVVWFHKYKIELSLKHWGGDKWPPFCTLHISIRVYHWFYLVILPIVNARISSIMDNVVCGWIVIFEHNHISKRTLQKIFKCIFLIENGSREVWIRGTT